MQLVVESASIANGLPVCVPAPQSGRRALAVGAACARSSGCRLESSFGFYERPRLAVHLAVEAAGIAQVMAVAVAPPERRLAGAAVDALAALDALALRARHQGRGNHRLVVVVVVVGVVAGQARAGHR